MRYSCGKKLHVNLKIPSLEGNLNTLVDGQRRFNHKTFWRGQEKWSPIEIVIKWQLDWSPGLNSLVGDKGPLSAGKERKKEILHTLYTTVWLDQKEWKSKVETMEGGRWDLRSIRSFGSLESLLNLDFICHITEKWICILWFDITSDHKFNSLKHHRFIIVLEVKHLTSRRFHWTEISVGRIAFLSGNSWGESFLLTISYF